MPSVSAVPEGHTPHLVEPGGENSPAGHFDALVSHGVAGLLSLSMKPAGHRVHFVTPGDAYVPGLQAVQCVAGFESKSA